MRHLVAAALVAAIAVGCNADSRQLQRQAEARWREGNYADAIRLYTLLYDRDREGRNAAQALLNIGDIYYLNQRQIKRAIETYKNLVGQFPERPEALKARAQLAAIYANEIGDLTQAIAEYDIILQAEEVDNRAEIQFKRASAYFGTGNMDSALRELRRIEESGISGHFADQVSLKIGSIYLMKKKYEDAADYFRRVMFSGCGDCRRGATIQLAETYDALYEYERAIDTIKKLDRTPENEPWLENEVARLTRKSQSVNARGNRSWDRARHR